MFKKKFMDIHFTLAFILSGLLYAEENIAVSGNRQYNINDYQTIYTGVGVSQLKLKDEFTKEEFSATGIAIQAGYQFNTYLSIEGRYVFHVGNINYDHGSNSHINKGKDINDYPADFTNIGIYLKPMYRIEHAAPYLLIGYGEVKLTNIPQGDADRVEAGFQWGVGISYIVNNHFSIYADYLCMYDDKGFDGRAVNRNIISDSWTFGLNYHF